MNVNEFWNIFEEELCRSITAEPEAYGLRPNEAPTDYARRVRIKMQGTAEAESLNRINLDSSTFRRVAKRLGIKKFSQGRLKEAYGAMGGK